MSPTLVLRNQLLRRFHHFLLFSARWPPMKFLHTSFESLGPTALLHVSMQGRKESLQCGGGTNASSLKEPRKHLICWCWKAGCRSEIKTQTGVKRISLKRSLLHSPLKQLWVMLVMLAADASWHMAAMSQVGKLAGAIKMRILSDNLTQIEMAWFSGKTLSNKSWTSSIKQCLICLRLNCPLWDLSRLVHKPCTLPSSPSFLQKNMQMRHIAQPVCVNIGLYPCLWPKSLVLGVGRQRQLTI